MERLPAQRRPHYPPIERLAILELRLARGPAASTRTVPTHSCSSARRRSGSPSSSVISSGASGA